MSERAPFPFFVGCGRSGTTLVRAIFDAHPQLAVPDESYFPLTFLSQHRRYELAGAFDTDRFLADLSADGSFANWHLDLDAVAAALRATPPANVPDAVRVVFATYAAAQHKLRYADKTPVFVRSMPRLAAAFPEARFVHIVRDGRNVALSRVAAAWSTERVDNEALIWRGVIAKGRHDGRRLGSERYREVRYEDLLGEPERVVRSLCSFLALDFDPAMLRYYERSAQLVADLPRPEEHGNLLAPPKTTRDWHDEMAPDDLAVFEAIAGRTLVQCGYERSATPVPVRAHAYAVARRARWRVRRSTRDLKSAVARRVRTS
jgi:hypothetical protein